jgi:hypothetical protein
VKGLTPLFNLNSSSNSGLQWSQQTGQALDLLPLSGSLTDVKLEGTRKVLCKSTVTAGKQSEHGEQLNLYFSSKNIFSIRAKKYLSIL